MDAMTLEGRLECAARELVDRARGIGLTLATAESCTAGLVAARIADIPGASDVLRGGAVTYCDAVKRRVLGVSEDTLRLHSAVSDPCAREMAVGARGLFEADMAGDRSLRLETAACDHLLLYIYIVPHTLPAGNDIADTQPFEITLRIAYGGKVLRSEKRLINQWSGASVEMRVDRQDK